MNKLRILEAEGMSANEAARHKHEPGFVPTSKSNRSIHPCPSVKLDLMSCTT